MGLLKTGLRAAVAVKTAYVIHEGVLTRQQEHAAAQGHPARAGAVAAWRPRRRPRPRPRVRRTWLTSSRSSAAR